MNEGVKKHLSEEMTYVAASTYLKENGQINPFIIMRKCHMNFEESKNVIEWLLKNVKGATRHPDEANFPNSLCLNNIPIYVKATPKRKI